MRWGGEGSPPLPEEKPEAEGREGTQGSGQPTKEHPCWGAEAAPPGLGSRNSFRAFNATGQKSHDQDLPLLQSVSFWRPGLYPVLLIITSSVPSRALDTLRAHSQYLWNEWIKD